jgi:hypothetical protein
MSGHTLHAKVHLATALEAVERKSESRPRLDILSLLVAEHSRITGSSAGTLGGNK